MREKTKTVVVIPADKGENCHFLAQGASGIRFVMGPGAVAGLGYMHDIAAGLVVEPGAVLEPAELEDFLQYFISWGDWDDLTLMIMSMEQKGMIPGALKNLLDTGRMEVAPKYLGLIERMFLKKVTVYPS